MFVAIEFQDRVCLFVITERAQNSLMVIKQVFLIMASITKEHCVIFSREKTVALNNVKFTPPFQ